jgi:hypothetical protein
MLIIDTALDIWDCYTDHQVWIEKLPLNSLSSQSKVLYVSFLKGY